MNVVNKHTHVNKSCGLRSAIQLDKEKLKLEIGRPNAKINQKPLADRCLPCDWPIFDFIGYTIWPFSCSWTTINSIKCLQILNGILEASDLDLRCLMGRDGLLGFSCGLVDTSHYYIIMIFTEKM